MLRIFLFIIGASLIIVALAIVFKPDKTDSTKKTGNNNKITFKKNKNTKGQGFSDYEVIDDKPKDTTPN